MLAVESAERLRLIYRAQVALLALALLVACELDASNKFREGRFPPDSGAAGEGGEGGEGN